MEAAEYQKATNDTAYYRVPMMAVLYPAYLGLGLAGEAGEVANLIKKVYRDQKANDILHRARILEEVGDCLWYIAQLCEHYGVEMEGLMADNIAKLRERHEITGKGL